MSKHFRTLDKLKNNIKHSNEFDAINTDSINVKLLLKSDFDKETSINIKNFNHYNQQNVKINKNTLEKINKIFNESFDINKKYLTNSEVKTIFIKMQNKMFGKEIFNKKRSRKNSEDKIQYSINEEYLNENLRLFHKRTDDGSRELFRNKNYQNKGLKSEFANKTDYFETEPLYFKLV